MKKECGYRVEQFTFNRRMATASAAVCSEKLTIHGITEVDITKPRKLMRKHKERTGEGLSLTAYVVTCFAGTLAAHPRLNAMRRGRKLIILDDITVGVLVERTIGGEKIPEPFAIAAAQNKGFRQIMEEVRAAQNAGNERLGSLSNMGWVRFIPGFLLKFFIRTASRSVRMARRYGIVSVSAVGMFGSSSTWFVPLSGSTVTVTVGSIANRPVNDNGRVEMREHLCLTVSFDHAIVDGAPAARFMKTFAAEVASAGALREILVRGGS